MDWGDVGGHHWDNHVGGLHIHVVILVDCVYFLHVHAVVLFDCVYYLHGHVVLLADLPGHHHLDGGAHLAGK